MTGPDHFLNAESDLEHAAHADSRGNQADVAYWLRSAQVHATLAVAAAMALVNYRGDGMTEGDRLAWYNAASAHPEHHRRQREAEAAEEQRQAEYFKEVNAGYNAAMGLETEAQS